MKKLRFFFEGCLETEKQINNFQLNPSEKKFLFFNCSDVKFEKYEQL